MKGFLVLSVILKGFFRLLRVRFLKWGRKRSQFSVALGFWLGFGREGGVVRDDQG